jgi:hypothetical protein
MIGHQYDADMCCIRCGHKHERTLDEILSTDEKILAEEKKIERSLEDIERWQKRPVSMKLQFEGATMDVSLTVSQTVLATVAEFDASGNVVAIVPANLSYTSSDATVATVGVNPDGSATVVAVAAGTSTITAADSAFPALTATGTVTVTGGGTTGEPVTMTLTFGTPTTPGV